MGADLVTRLSPRQAILMFVPIPEVCDSMEFGKGVGEGAGGRARVSSRAVQLFDRRSFGPRTCTANERIFPELFACFQCCAHPSSPLHPCASSHLLKDLGAIKCPSKPQDTAFPTSDSRRHHPIW